MKSSRWTVLFLPALACASVAATSIPECASLEVSPSLPEASCAMDERTIAFREHLRDLIASDVESVYFSVLLDAASRAEGLCIAPSRTTGKWSERGVLAGRSEALAKLSAGPACLAGRRLDFNRKSAIESEITRVQNQCDAATRGETKIAIGFGEGVSSLMALPRSACSQSSDEWILLAPGRLEPAMIFVRPEVEGPQSESAQRTRKTCSKFDEVEKRVACFGAHGWELLE